MNKYETAMDKIKQEYSAELEKVKKEADEIQADYRHCGNDIKCIKKAIEDKQFDNLNQRLVQNKKNSKKRQMRR